MDGKIRSAEQWAIHLNKLADSALLIVAGDIEQIQREAIESYKAQHYNPGNIARAERIKNALRGINVVTG